MLWLRLGGATSPWFRPSDASPDGKYMYNVGGVWRTASNTNSSLCTLYIYIEFTGRQISLAAVLDVRCHWVTPSGDPETGVSHAGTGIPLGSRMHI
jgi:hypothetical protein